LKQIYLAMLAVKLQGSCYFKKLTVARGMACQGEVIVISQNDQHQLLSFLKSFPTMPHMHFDLLYRVRGPLVLINWCSINWYWGPLVQLSIDAQSTGNEPTGTGTAFVRIYGGKGVSLTLTTVWLWHINLNYFTN
jgi:hypothetical protein